MKYFYGVSFFMLALVFHSRAQLTINTNYTDQVLIQSHLLGPGICAKNITWTGTQAQRGRFNCTGPCNVGFSSGVLITSGQANNALGPNNSGSQGTDLFLPGDANLNTLVPGSSGQDAGVIEFDFSVPSDSVQFRFVFASEEYNDFVNSACNDVFGFFISGPGYAGPTNIALIPNTATAIAINNVNNGWSAAGVPPSGPCLNCAYYRDNTGGVGVEYDGMTVVLTASARVQPCTEYHFKMAVQDNCDGIYDSGVFFEANSFQAMGEIPLIAGTDTLESSDTLYICAGDTIKVSLPTGPNYLWSNGSTTQDLVITQPGIYYGTLSDTCCFAFSVILTVLNQAAAAAVTPQGPTTFCTGDSVVLTATPNGANLTYLWSNGATTPSITVHNSGNYFVTINSGGNCSAISPTVQVTVNNGAIAQINPSGPLTFCSGGNVTLTSANAANSYLWSNGATTNAITVNSSGTYTLTLTSSGCVSTTNVNVTVNNPTPVNITTPGVACVGTPTLLNATAGMQSYQWSSGQNTAQISVSTAGTYTVTATNASGCTSVTSYAYAPLPFTAPTISSPAGFCSGLTGNLVASAGYSGYLWNNGIATATNTVSAGGTYTVTVTAANGCTGTASASIQAWPLPTPSITGTFTVCDGAAANLTAGPAGAAYLWSDGSTTPTISPLLAGTYTVTVTDANNCSASASQVVNVNSAPVFSITGDFDACQGSSGSMAATAGFGSYQWSNGSITNSIAPSAQGWYIVTVTDNGCSSIDSSFFTVHALPQPSITGNLSFCSGTNTTLQVSQPFSSYTWTGGATGNSITVSTSGTYTVTVTDANNCSNSTSATVQANALPVPVITGNFIVCDGTAATLTAGPAAMNYVWSDGSVTQTISPLTAGVYTVTVTDLNNCSASISQAVTVNPIPVFSITGDFDACQGNSGTMTGTPGFASYQWSNGSNTATINPSSQGWYYLTVTDNGCSAVDSSFFTVLALPQPVITGTPAFCPGLSTTLQVSQPFNSYLWSDGTSSNSITTGQASTYTVTVTDANGCSNNTSVNVTAWPQPQPVLPAAVSICQGDNYTFQPGVFQSYIWSDNSTGNSLTINTGGVYSVTVTDANGCTANASSQLTVNPLPTPVVTGPAAVCDGELAIFSTGTYSSYQWSDGTTGQQMTTTTSGTYTVSVTDNNGCTNSASASLIVNPLPLASVSGPTDFCDGGSVTISAVSGQGSYQWSTGATGNFINVDETGTYQVTVTSALGCTNSASYQVNERPHPAVDFDLIQSPGCEHILVQFLNLTSAETGTTYLWHFGDSTGSVKTSPQHSYYTPGDYLVQLYATSPYGCKGEDSMTITVDFPPPPIAAFEFSPDLVSIYNSKVKFVNKSQHSIRYKWNFGDGHYSEEMNPEHYFDNIGTQIITLFAYNSDTCYDEVQLPLEVAPFWLPNAFTPNNDGKNDRFFEAGYMMDVSSFDMQIYDRWGKRIYRTDSMSKPWDGTHEGSDAPEGVFTYLIHVTSNQGKTLEYKGTFSLIR